MNATSRKLNDRYRPVNIKKNGYVQVIGVTTLSMLLGKAICICLELPMPCSWSQESKTSEGTSFTKGQSNEPDFVFKVADRT